MKNAFNVRGCFLVFALLFLLFASCKKNSGTPQVPPQTLPVINSFTPATGSAGTTVTDIYDVSTDTWTTAQLSEARTTIAAASAGNKILFGSGQTKEDFPFTPSKSVDIYDLSTNAWTTAQLSEARTGLGATSAGNRVVFAGGQTGNDVVKTVDISDVQTGVWND